MAKLLALKHGLQLPRLYELGFGHNNCGGGCVKAGQSQWALLYRTMPERYAEHQAKEEELRKFLSKDVTILRDRRGGKTCPLTLKAFAARLDVNPELALEGESHACQCFA